jgi:hypothetical protein
MHPRRPTLPVPGDALASQPQRRSRAAGCGAGAGGGGRVGRAKASPAPEPSLGIASHVNRKSGGNPAVVGLEVRSGGKEGRDVGNEQP